MSIEYKNDAENARSQSNYDEAGRYYTLAAYDALSECNFPKPEDVTTGTDIGIAIYCLQNAAFTFRLAGNDARCDNRVSQAVLIVEDFEEYTFQYDALKGLARESIADLQLIAGNENQAIEEYEAAQSRYATVPQTDWLAETIFEWSFEFFREVMVAAGDSVSVPDQITMLNSFEARVTAKRDKLPGGIETVLETQTY